MKFLKYFKTKSQSKLIIESSISSLAPKILTSKEDIENIKPYLVKLDETIKAKDVNNIAITGGYGSGKSTILKTFKDQHPENKYLNISLAAFNQNEIPPEGKDKENLERLLEVSILQQIFYHIKPNKIPESRFKRIVNISWWKYLLISTAFVLWVLSTIILFKYDYIDKINPLTWVREYSFDWIALFLIIITFSGVGFTSKLIIQLFSNSKINKVNIKGELELGDKVSKSVFNEHLEEIFYFFEKTEYNVVIIEDLDRFDNTNIFTKLREINTLLNNTNLIAREINFIYAVGDDLFKDKKERVKFFEYIIPVIPFINSSNAKDQLLKLIRQAELSENIFSNEFLSDVITFIDDIDMRLLINIFHEFVVYERALKPEFIKNQEELFAIIIYKNIEPEDFTLLNNKQGNLYTLIKNKKIYIDSAITSLNQTIVDKQKAIEKLSDLSITDIKELRSIYLNKVLSKLPKNSILDDSLADLLEDDGFGKVIKGEISYTRYKVSHSSYYFPDSLNLNFAFDELQEEVNKELTYQERINLIKDKSINQIDRLKAEIEKLKQRRQDITSWDLKKILEEITYDLQFGEFSNSELVRSLIFNGYINENYNDYISLFHEGSVSRSDLLFERDVKGGSITDFHYKLEKIEGLIERIPARYFGRESILNIDLMNYLGNNYQNHKALYDAIIDLLSNEREHSIEFINEYIKDENRPIAIFIEKLTKRWSNFYYYIVEKSKYGQPTLTNYLRLILKYGYPQDILNQDQRVLNEMISYNDDFLSLIKTKNDSSLRNKIKGIIKDLKIKFVRLQSPTDETKELFDYVYQNNLYRINVDNIKQMIQIYTDDIDMELFLSKNYSIIRDSKASYLSIYIDKNINEYIDHVFLEINTSCNEDEHHFITLINNENITERNKLKILHRTETKISDISTINDEFIEMVLKSNKLQPTWENIYLLFQYEDIDDKIIDFINIIENAERLSKIDVPQIKDDNNKMYYIQMWKDILAHPSISMEAFKLILNAGKILIRYFDFENTSEERLKMMIDQKCFAFEKNVFDDLDDFYSLGTHYLEIYKTEFLQFNEGFEFEEYQLALILCSKKYVLDNLNVIFEEFDISTFDSPVFLSNLQYRLSIEKGLKVDSEKIVQAILASKSDSTNIKILVNYFERFGKEEIKEIFKSLNNREFQSYLSSNTSESMKLSHGEQNDRLFELMKQSNFISEKSKKTKEGYLIYKNKTTETL